LYLSILRNFSEELCAKLHYYYRRLLRRTLQGSVILLSSLKYTIRLGSNTSKNDMLSLAFSLSTI